MLQYVCDTCGAVREGLDNSWILGFAAEAVGVTAARRQVTLLPRWDEDQAVRWLAVHFCCEDCKDAYMAVLFDEVPAVPEVEETTIAVRPGRAAKKLTRIETAPMPARTKTRTTVKRSSRKTAKRRAS